MSALNNLEGEAYHFLPDVRGFYNLRLLEGEDFSMSDVLEINTHIRQNLNGEIRPFLIELGYGATVQNEVQEHLVQSNNRYSSADGILISTYAHELISKFYIRRYKPVKPTRVFTDRDEALAWIKLLKENGEI